MLVVGGVLIALIDMGKPSPLWVALFPKQGVLDSIYLERVLSRSGQLLCLDCGRDWLLQASALISLLC